MIRLGKSRQVIEDEPMTDETETLPPPSAGPTPPPSAPPPGRLLPTRSSTDRYLAGVAGGVGHRLGFEPTLIRGVLVGATIALATSVQALVPLLYLGAWLLLPTTLERPLLARLFTRAGAQEIAAAVLLAILVIGVLSGDDTWLTVFLVIAGLLLADVLLSRSAGKPSGATAATVNLDDEATEARQATSPGERATVAARWGRSFRARRAEPTLRPETGTPVASDGSDEAVEHLPPLLRRYLEPGSSSIFTPTTRRPRRQPALWPLTLAALVVWVVATISLDQLVDPGIAPGVIVNGAIIIVGAVIALSAWRGRAGLLTWLLLIPLGFGWLIFSVDDVHRYRVDGLQRHTPQSVEPGDTLTFASGYGDLDIDLSNLELPERSEITVRVRQTGGRVHIVYPDDMAIAGSAKVRLGSIHTVSSWNEGIHANSRIRRGAGPDCSPWRDGGPICDEDAPTIIFDIDAGVSSVDIRHPHDGENG